jgi:AraC-like DNA-binding protein
MADSHAALEAYANLIVLLLDRELRQVRHSRKTSDLRSRIERGWGEVCSDLAFPWTVEILADKAGMSTSQFNRVVKRFHKMTPMAVVTNYRMQRAAEMLISTDHTLEAIAASIGYETAFAFSRAFKRHEKVSPSEFRKGLQSS